MSTRSFFAPDARTRVHDAIGEVERQTSAEIVVARCRASGHYRQADLAAGAPAALGALCVLRYSPAPFDFTFLPLELAERAAFTERAP